MTASKPPQHHRNNSSPGVPLVSNFYLDRIATAQRALTIIFNESLKRALDYFATDLMTTLATHFRIRHSQRGTVPPPPPLGPAFSYALAGFITSRCPPAPRTKITSQNLYSTPPLSKEPRPRVAAPTNCFR